MRAVMFRSVLCAAVVTMVVLSVGCAAPATGDAFQPEVVQPDQAVMYIYRDSRAFGNAPLRITINDQAMGELKSGEYLAAVVTPGSFLVRAEGKSGATRELKLHGGDVAYLRIAGGNKPSFQEPEADVAQREIAKTRRIGTK